MYNGGQQPKVCVSYLHILPGTYQEERQGIEMSKKGYAMLDGIAMGTEYDTNGAGADSGRIECKNPKELWNVLETHAVTIGIKPGKELTVKLGPAQSKELKREVFIDLKKTNNSERWFLNLRTNPASVFSGENTFGSLLVVKQLRNLFDFILDWIESKGGHVKRMRDLVRKGEIGLSSISFAVYSGALKNSNAVAMLMDRWYFMYETRVKNNDGQYISLLEALGVTRGTGEQYKSSISLNIYKYNMMGKKLSAVERGTKLMHLCVYNKAEELRSRDKIEEGSKLENDLDKRLRFDLTVSAYHFRGGGQHLTLRSLNNEMKKRGSWSVFVEEMLDYAMDRTCLQYMVNCPNVWASEHKEMVSVWLEEIERKKGHGRGAWSDDLCAWAVANDVNLNVSPMAHMIMLQGRMGLTVNTEDNVKKWLTSSEGAKEYLTTMRRVIEVQTRRVALKGAKNIPALTFDFGAARS